MGLTNMSVPIDGAARTPLLMPKLQNRFRISFDNDTRRFITGNVVSVTRPTLSFDPVTLDVYNSRIYIPGKHTWNPVEIVVRDTVGSETVKVIEDQLARQIDMATQSTRRAAGAFKFKASIENLDGFNPAIGNVLSDNILDTWELYGCYIENVTYGNNDYSASEPIAISITLKYDNAAHIHSGSTDALSSPTPTNNITDGDLSTTGVVSG